MKQLLKILQNKYFWIVVLVIILIMSFGSNIKQLLDNNELNTYNRQLSGQLSDQERELQKANKDLGVAKSELVSQKELAQRLKEDNEELDKDFNAFVEKHNLQIRNKDRVIAKLQDQIKNGSSGANVKPKDPETANICDNIDQCVISYFWQDEYQRFKLEDPDVLETGNEIFTRSQLFKVYGEVWEQQDGSLQTKRLVLREMYRDAEGTLIEIPGAKAEIIDSEFIYSNAPSLKEEWKWTDLFRLRGIVVASVAMFPDTGNLKLGVGLEFISWQGLGINSHTAFDFQDPNKIEQRIGLAYSPQFFDFQLNLALGVSVGTPFMNAFDQFSVNVGLLFYINE